MMHRIIRNIAVIALGGIMVMCSPKVPDKAATTNSVPRIYPDYKGVTVPVNIAPLNFKINEHGRSFVTRLTGADGQEMVVDGKVARFDIKPWHQLLHGSMGSEIKVEVFAKGQDQWVAYQPFTIAVADSIDPYISYRLIEPSYVSYENMSINQRCLENFDESEVLCSAVISPSDKGHCLNCHSYQDFNREGNMQLHVRGSNGGTLVHYQDSLRKINIKCDSAISNGVYPSWHPTLPLIAYSTNITHQSFHTVNSNKVEVQDDASDLVLYDVERDAITLIAADSTQWETFPYWSPDGTVLYYASAAAPELEDGQSLNNYETTRYRDIKYNLYRRSFDPATRTFGPVDTIVDAARRGLSATLPRPSRDGRYLVYTVGEYGTFHIWHHDADLYVLDLTTGENRPLTEANSPDTESYHSFSSNGRWLLFSSRRDDGSFTRLYIAYFDELGRARRPFLLPQQSPDHNILRLKSYNVPEFMAKPIVTTTGELRSVIDNY